MGSNAHTCWFWVSGCRRSRYFRRGAVGFWGKGWRSCLVVPASAASVLPEAGTWGGGGRGERDQAGSSAAEACAPAGGTAGDVDAGRPGADARGELQDGVE